MNDVEDDDDDDHPEDCNCGVVEGEESESKDSDKDELDESESKDSDKDELDESESKDSDKDELDESESDVGSESDSEVEDVIILNNDSEDIIKTKMAKIFINFRKHVHCYKFEGLDRLQRRLIHEIVEEKNLEIFHFTKNGYLNISNDQKDRKIFEKYSRLKKLAHQNEQKIESLNQKLTDLSLSNVRKSSILYEIASITSQKISGESKKAALEVSQAISKNISCPICLEKGINKMCCGDKGLNLHLIKSHKIKKN